MSSPRARSSRSFDCSSSSRTTSRRALRVLWNVSEVKNMDHMFYGAEDFNQPLNNWKVSKCRRQFRGKVGSDGFEKVLIGTRGAREDQ